MSKKVVILGGGLAGLASATALAEQGFTVELYESRQRLGGRASSFQDLTSGQMVDTCQHVTMGCCTEFARFCNTVGIDHFLQPQRTLYFMTPDRRVSRFQSDPLPAPLHLARSFLGLHHLTLMEKFKLGRALLKLKKEPVDADPPFLDWLKSHGQTQRMIDRFWGLVLISALNEEPDRCGLKYARKVFVDGFLNDRRGFEVSLPTVPLGRLYGRELQTFLEKHGTKLHLGVGIKSIQGNERQVEKILLRDGREITADYYVSAVPFDRLLSMLPTEWIEQHSYFSNMQHLETSPITSAHCWYDRPVTKLPHVVLVDGLGQWVFNRGEVAPNEYYLQVVISAARQFRGLNNSQIEQQLTAELSRLFPAAKPHALKRCRIVTEHAATFSAVPGVDQWRPQQQSPIENLFIAGDWTATGWPATMEGAVRSGYLAAKCITR